MLMTDPMVLPPDVLVVQVKDLPESVRRQVEAAEDDHALTRPNSRTPSRIVDSAAAELLQEFRKPVTIVEAVIRYSRRKDVDPEQTLEEAFPMLERLAKSRLLVPSDSLEAMQILPSLEAGSRFLEYEVERCVQSMEDTELYLVKSEGGERAALKLARGNASEQVLHMFDRESAILTQLGGEFSPKLLRDSTTGENQRYLLLEWCPGQDSASAAATLRSYPTLTARRQLLLLCCAILDAYARLHEKRVIHSDIHMKNVIVDGVSQVKLIDFGYARVSGVENQFRRAQRAGVAYFFEPECAASMRSGQNTLPSTMLGEQYALAVLLYALVIGNHYLEFSLEPDEMLRQIAEDPPVSFVKRGAPAWPELELILAKALSKRPEDRFQSIAEFAAALRAIVPEASAKEESTKPAAYPDAEEMLERLLARLDVNQALFASGIQSAPRVSVAYGSAGVAYGLYRIACAQDDSFLLSVADLWVTRAARDLELSDAFYSPDLDITPQRVGRVSPYHTASGVYLVQVLVGQAMGDLMIQRNALERFLVAVQQEPCKGIDVTLGRSGVLLGAAFLLEATAGSQYLESTAVAALGNRLLEELWEEIDSFRPISECTQISYTGAAHGWAGILFATMNWCKSSGTALPSRLEERLHQLAKLAENSGRGARWKWGIRPAHISAQTGAYMAGWCNGSAGFVYLWTLAHRILGRDEYGALAERAAYDTWQSESQVGNLCCGYAGQAYALLNMYKHSGDEAWLHRAQALAQRAAHSVKEMPSTEMFADLAKRPESLYKGELGVAVLAADLAQPKFAVMPFFEAEV